MIYFVWHGACHEIFVMRLRVTVVQTNDEEWLMQNRYLIVAVLAAASASAAMAAEKVEPAQQPSMAREAVQSAGDAAITARLSEYEHSIDSDDDLQ